MKPESHPELMETARKAQRPDGALWVFGYGSLMWDPGLEADKMRPARLYGYHRRFCLRSSEAWGTPDSPGLCATLHPGGSAAGRGMLLAPDRVEAGLSALGRREAAYLPRHVRIRVRGRNGGADWQGALTFVFDSGHPRAAGGLSVSSQVLLIRQGHGHRGSSHGYLRRVVKELRRDGSRDRAAEKLLHAADLNHNNNVNLVITC